MAQVILSAGQIADQFVQTGVDLRQPAAVVDAVGHVLELIRLHAVSILKHIAAENTAVQRGHAVDRHAAGDAQVGHTDLVVPDDGHILDLGLVAEIERRDLLLPAAGDLADDLPHAGQQGLHQILGPALQGFRQDGVVGVGHGIGGNVPGFVPAQSGVIHQNPHQLRNHQRGVGVVDLNDVFLMEVGHSLVVLDVLAHNGLHGGGHKEVLLAQAKALALIMVVLRVEDLGDYLRHSLLLAGPQIFALAEQAHVDRLGTLGVPQAQRVGVLGLVTGNGHVAGNSQHAGIILIDNMQVVAVPELPQRTAEVDLLHLVRLGD